jgi:hypothetical protein
MRDWKKNKLLSAPAYSAVEAARILSVNYTTLMYWIAGRRYHSALIKLASSVPPELSFVNLIECHALKALTVRYRLRLQRIRGGLETLKKTFDSEHPLLDERFSKESHETDPAFCTNPSDAITGTSRRACRLCGPDRRRFHYDPGATWSKRSLKSVRYLWAL